MMRLRASSVFRAVVLVVLAGASAAADDRIELRARLTGFEEVPPISTTGRGDFRAEVEDEEMQFRLRYSNLEGGSIVGAHIHFGQSGVNGGIVVHFCGTGGKPACPPAPATLEGTITAADVVGVAAQGIAAGEFDEVLRAIRAGRGYVNVHTTTFSGGEIRGQIKVEDDD
jgi:hypothetical protein